MAGVITTHGLLRACAGTALLISLSAKGDDNFFQTIETAETASQTSADKSWTSGWDTRAYLLQTLKYGWQSPSADDGFGRNQAGISQVKTTLFGEGQGDWNDSVGWQLSVRGENEWYFWEAGDSSWQSSETRWQSSETSWQSSETSWQSHNSELRLRDAFIDVTHESLWLRGGQQILAWGQAESLVITDVLSPQDLREPGQAELQDIREPVPALLGSLSLNSATKLSLVVTYAAGSNRYADAQEAFDFFAPYRNTGIHIVEQDPTSEWEFALKLDHSFNGGDLSLMAARVNDNNLALTDLDLPGGTLYLGQQRQTVIGGALGWVRGNWLLKSEVAHWQDVPVATVDSSPWPLHDQSRAMAGLEYSGWDRLLLSLEANAVHTESHSADLAVDTSDAGYSARLRHTAFNERVIQQIRIFKLASEEAYVGRWELSVDWSDEWTFTGGVVVYRVDREASLFYPLRHHDSVNLSAKYSF